MNLYIIVSLMMFFEFAIWGAWMPVLAGRLLGPLKMSGKQTGWVYATLPLGCMIATPIVGQLADTTFDARWMMVACHAVGAVMLFIAAKQKSFVGIFTTMFLYSLCYAATLPLVNTILFKHIGEIGVDPSGGTVFIWAPVAWAFIGYILSGYRATRKVEGDQSDGLKLAALCSVIMVVVCCFQPETLPGGAKEGGGMIAALALMKEPSFAIFVTVTLCVAGLQQFYFLGSAQMIQDIGMSVKSVPGVMAIAQATQAVATWFLMGYLIVALGYPLTLTIGVLCWGVLFMVYSFARTPIFIVPVQAFHGLAYVLFIIVGYAYGNAVATADNLSSVQSLVVFLQTGLALFLATQVAGYTMSLSADKKTGKFNWTKVYMVPLVITILGAALLMIGMKDPVKAADPGKDGKNGTKTEKQVEEGDIPNVKVTGGEEVTEIDEVLIEKKDKE